MPPPSLDLLRAVAEAQAVRVEDEDLERVRAFLTVLYPAFEEVERLVPKETPPAGLFLPVEEP